jgi:hypothetical protein
MSDDNENVATCQSAGALCTQCSEEFCNSQGGYSNIECLSCSSIHDPSCGYFLPLNRPMSTHTCADLINRDNFCVSFKNGSSYHRGCLSDFQQISVASCMARDDCEICDDNYCNNEQLVIESCYQCDSSVEGCRDGNVFREKAAICRDVTVERTGCFHYEKGEKGHRAPCKCSKCRNIL